MRNRFPIQFNYSTKGDFLINDLSFTLKSGESLGIFGATGSGKSTLANLICRLYEISKGEYLINNHNINDIELNSFRNLIGYVPQDVFLFSDTITNNIAFGLDDGDFTDQEVKDAAVSAGIYDEITKASERKTKKLKEIAQEGPPNYFHIYLKSISNAFHVFGILL